MAIWSSGSELTLVTDAPPSLDRALAWARAVLPPEAETEAGSGNHPALHAIRRAGGVACTPALPAEAAGASVAAPSLSVLWVINRGPDAGTCFSLPRGLSVMGRGPHRIAVRDATVARREVEVLVDHTGVQLRRCGRARFQVDGRPRSWARVDERHAITIGANEVRLLPRAPAPPPPAPEASLTLHPPWSAPPRAPWLPALGAVAPLGVGAGLVWMTGQWFVLLIGLAGLLTGGVQCLSDLRQRRSFRRRSVRAAREHAASLRAAFPPPGQLLAAWRHPSWPPPRPEPGRSPAPPPVRLGTHPIAGITVDVPGASKREVACAVLPALLAPQLGDTVCVLGPHAEADAALGAIACAWMPALVTGRARLVLSCDTRLPATLLRLPGIELSARCESWAMRYEAVIPAGEATTPTVEVVLREVGGDPWIVDLAAGTVLPPIVQGQAASASGEPSARGGFHAAHPDRGRAGERTRRPRRRGRGRALPSGTRGRAWSMLPEGPCPEALSTAARALAESLTPALDPAHRGGQAPGVAGREIPLGRIGQAAFSIELERDGPHALIAGATGSGKSELLRAWITAWAERRTAAELRLVLFDFKGGATFAPMASLPHVEELVTDLEVGAVSRVLDSLSRELGRREAWLRACGHTDLAEAEADGTHSGALPARIAVVVDEFRVLAEEAPSVLERMVRLATVGRSLGVHLILATQRPQGIVSADIRANMSLVLCLRVASEVDSLDVLGTAAASRLPADDPGRCLVRIGSEEPVAVKVDSVSGGDHPEAARLIGPRCCDRLTVTLPRSQDAGWSARLATAAASAGSRPAPFVRPALPSGLVRIAAPTLTPARSAGALVLGLRSAATSTHPWLHHFGSEGHLALVGPAPAEQARLLAGLLQGAPHRALAGRSVVFDGTGRAEDPGCGFWLTPDRLNEADEVLDELVHGGSVPQPAIVWVLSPERWWGEGGDALSLRREAAFTALLRGGTVGVLAMGGRDLALSRHLSLFPHRAYASYGVTAESRQLWPRLGACAEVPGRAMLLQPGGDPLGTEVQLMVAASRETAPHGPAPDGTARRGAGPRGAGPHGDEDVRDGGRRRVPAEASAGSKNSMTDRPLAWDPLPSHIRRSTGAGADEPRADVTAIGVRRLSLEPLRWPLASGLVLGGRGSGRSTAVAVAVAAASARTATASGIEHEFDRPGLALPPTTALPDRGGSACLWILDDVDQRPYEDQLLIAEHLRRGGRVLASARSTPHPAGRLPWFALLDPLSDIALMGPRHRLEAEELGWAVPPDAHAPPGRGWLVPLGERTPIRMQWYTP